MMATPSYKLVVISDLHLSEGWDEDGYLQKKEDFFLTRISGDAWSRWGRKRRRGIFRIGW